MLENDAIEWKALVSVHVSPVFFFWFVIVNEPNESSLFRSRSFVERVFIDSNKLCELSELF